MPVIERHEPGSFCWMELGTTDQQAAKSYYNALLNWTFTDHPMGPDSVYTMFEYKGKTAAAGYQIAPDMKGVPPHWMLYIAVESADAAAAKCSELGGKVVAGPFDVGPNGRMAVLEDPVGAKFCVWEPKATAGVGIAGEPNTFCWADLSCAKPEVAAPFYEALFGWTTDPGDDGSGYLHIRNKGVPIGGIPPGKYANPNVPPHWLLYFNVDDVDASTAKALQMGATVHISPTDISNVGRFSMIADPQGAVSCLFKEGSRQ